MIMIIDRQTTLMKLMTTVGFSTNIKLNKGIRNCARYSYFNIGNVGNDIKVSRLTQKPNESAN